MLGRDDHALARRQVTRGGEPALALDVDEARPAGAERRAIRVLAELGQGDREAVPPLEDRRALGKLDLASVDREPHRSLMIARTRPGTRRGPRVLRAGRPGRAHTARRPGSPRRASSRARARRAVERLEEPRGPLPARRALAARLAHVEGEQRAHRVGDRRAVVEGDDPARPRVHRTARHEWLVELPRGDDAARRPAQDRGVDRPARRGAAAELLHQHPERRAELHLDQPRAPDVAGEPEELRPAAAAEAREPGAALGDDGRHGAERLDVVDDGRLAPEPGLDGEGRARAGHRAMALDGFEERGLLAEDEAAGAAAKLDVEREVGADDALAEESPLARLRHGHAEPQAREWGLVGERTIGSDLSLDV